ncbi:MAG TPA: ThuA domain-containing protein, partial [Fimbriimonas sp.]
MLATLACLLFAKPDLNVLVFSKTAGFRHDCIPIAVQALRDVAEERGWQIEATEDATAFTAENLKRFQSVVFMCTTGDVLDPDQEKAFQAYVENGGGYVGVHSATDTEYGWDWYGRLVGTYFAGHPHIQSANIKVEDRAHATTSFLPEVWTRNDEWYNFRPTDPGAFHVLAKLDESTYRGGNMNG